MRAKVGTSGFSYPAWKGSFYPEAIKSADMLAHYSQKLPSVELNNTFYRMPRRAVLLGWAQKTPPTFRFAVKASRRITHFKKLRDCEELIGYLYSGLGVLGQRLGPVLFQLPPTLTFDLPLLKSFLELLPASLPSDGGVVETPVRAAFEFRHASWARKDVQQLLSDHSAALVAGDTDAGETVEFSMTAPFAYLRLRKPSYADEELDRWASVLSEAGVEQTFAYFKHEEHGPRLALSLLGRF